LNWRTVGERALKAVAEAEVLRATCDSRDDDFLLFLFLLKRKDRVSFRFVSCSKERKIKRKIFIGMLFVQEFAQNKRV